jgi:thiamine-phosphate pyrophosphorylase
MFREKDLEAADQDALARQVMGAISPDATLVINGDPALADTIGAAGAHVQSLDAVREISANFDSDFVVGYSAHSADDAHAAAMSGADYVTLSPVFLTDSKPGYGPALGLDYIQRLVPDVAVPVIGLAGITSQNAADVIDAGAAGVAVMGHIMRSPDPGTETRKIIAAIS